MFEREIKFIYDFNLNKVNKLGPYFTFEQLQSVDLHPAILNYISAEIDYLVFEDRQKLLKNSVFDYSGEKIAFHFGEITDELKKIKRFSLEYIAKLILHATSFSVNYLVRPKWTLTRFIFDEAKHKSSNEIKQILNYVYYYKFVKKIIVSYINTKKILSMNAEEFEELLNRTDKLGMESNLKGIMSSSLISMAEFFNIGQMQKTRIPLTAVELFLEEKDLPLHLQKITETLGSDENAHFHIGDYMKVITSVMTVRKEEEPLKRDMLLFEEQADAAIEEKETEEENFFEDYETAGNEIDAIEKIVEHEGAPEEELTDEVPFLEQVEESTEIIATDEEEVRITPNSKIRIKVNEDNKIEPVLDEEEEEVTQLVQEKDEKFDSYSTVIKGFDDDDDEIPEDQELIVENEHESGIENSLLNIINIEEEKTSETAEEELDEEETELKSEDPDVQELYFSSNDTTFVNEEEELINKIDSVREAIDLEDTEEEDEIVQQRFEEQTKFELSEILEHKHMTKIIEVVFDYDIEDFANMLDEISNCKNVDDAHFVINETLANRRINRNSKEAETLREIISGYFDRQ